MPGPAPKPEGERRRRNVPAGGEWRPAPGEGWQFGDVPKPPPGLVKATRDAWGTWMGSWFAAFWTPDDLPGLRVVARLYDQVERGEFQRASELRLQMAAYGMTPEGQQKRRWRRPEVPVEGQRPRSSGKYSHLRAVGD